jgi:hypothetical protein
VESHNSTRTMNDVRDALGGSLVWSFSLSPFIKI